MEHTDVKPYVPIKRNILTLTGSKDNAAFEITEMVKLRREDFIKTVKAKRNLLV
jgi:hypothetical protein